MSDQMIELFVQGEEIGEVLLIRVPRDVTVRDVIQKARTECGLEAGQAEVSFLIEDKDEEISLDAKLSEVGVGHRHRVHFNQCWRAKVSVNFNGVTKAQPFSPSATIGKIKRWADHEFGLKGVDATEHALQLCGISTRPDLDVHVGSLVKHPDCQICFDLVPKKRVEG